MIPRGRFTLTVLSLALLLPVGAPAQDQPQPAEKPIAVMAFSGLDNVMGDLQKLFAAADAQQQFGLIAGLAQANTAGIDPKRPWGAAVTMWGEEAKLLGFVPVTDLEQVLALPALQATLPEPEKLDGGVLHFKNPDTDQSMYVKQRAGWAFVAEALEQLDELPADPVALLEGLEKEYDYAFRFYVQRVPQSARERLMNPEPLLELDGDGDLELNDLPPDAKRSDEPAADEDENDPDEEPDPTEEMLQRLLADSFSQMQAEINRFLFNHFEEFTVGFVLDGETMKSRIDLAVTVLGSSPAAPRLEALAEARSAHAGILTSDAMMATHYAIRLLPEDAAFLAAMLEASYAEDQPLDLPPDADEEERAEAQRQREWEQLMKQIVLSTLRGGKFDGGLAVYLEPGNSSFVWGGTVGKPEELATLAGKLMEEARAEFELQGKEPKTQEYKGFELQIFERIPFAAIDKPADEPLVEEEFDAEKYFGETFDLVMAVKETDFYVVLGTGAVKRLQQVIDANQRVADQPVAPFTLGFGVRQFLELAAEEEQGEMPQHVRERLEQTEGPDRVLIQLTASGRSAGLRIEIEKLPLVAIVLAALEQPPFKSPAAEEP